MTNDGLWFVINLRARFHLADLAQNLTDTPTAQGVHCVHKRQVESKTPHWSLNQRPKLTGRQGVAFDDYLALVSHICCVHHTDLDLPPKVAKKTIRWWDLVQKRRPKLYERRLIAKLPENQPQSPRGPIARHQALWTLKMLSSVPMSLICNQCK